MAEDDCSKKSEHTEEPHRPLSPASLSVSSCQSVTNLSKSTEGGVKQTTIDDELSKSKETQHSSELEKVPADPIRSNPNTTTTVLASGSEAELQLEVVSSCSPSSPEGRRDEGQSRPKVVGRVKRRLWEVHSEQVDSELSRELKRMRRDESLQKSARWNFDFERETPLSGDWQWKETQEAPTFFKSKDSHKKAGASNPSHAADSSDKEPSTSLGSSDKEPCTSLGSSDKEPCTSLGSSDKEPSTSSGIHAASVGECSVNFTTCDTIPPIVFSRASTTLFEEASSRNSCHSLPESSSAPVIGSPSPQPAIPPGIEPSTSLPVCSPTSTTSSTVASPPETISSPSSPSVQSTTSDEVTVSLPQVSIQTSTFYRTRTDQAPRPRSILRSSSRKSPNEEESSRETSEKRRSSWIRHFR